MEKINLESDIQQLIFDFPWLLDINYERIYELENQGFEHKIDDSRIDLLLRHRISGRPVIVEFKFGGFYRENIGQILEYRTRVILELKNDYSGIEDIFKEKLLAPILCLGVEECSDQARVACNLNGIEVYEYKNQANELNKSQRSYFSDLEASINEYKYLSYTRYEIVDEFYSQLNKALTRAGIIEEADWKQYKPSPGEYWYSYQHMFINKWLFSSQDISVGLYENISHKNKPRFVLGFFSDNECNLIMFLDDWNREHPDKEIKHESIIKINDERYAELFLTANSDDNAIEEYIGLLRMYMNIAFKKH